MAGQPANWVLGNYILGQLGSGAFGVVWYGRHGVHRTEVAIKEINTRQLDQDPKAWERLKTEISIPQRINHSNIVRLYDVIEAPDSGRIYLVLEYCNGGDLSSYIRSHNNGRGVGEATAKYFMQQLAAGLQVLYHHNVVHRDLKPQNLLLSSNNGRLVLKIADFGLARFLHHGDHAATLVGTLAYMAPEVKSGLPYDAKADLYSVGVILFELVTGRPFIPNNAMQVLHYYNPNLSGECNDLCQRLLQPNPEDRLAFDEFLSDPFLS